MPRIPTLEGACNFRDFGGYTTTDGRRVRWGRLFRSGAMHRFTAADRQQVAGLGVRIVCDLRRPGERERQPDPDFGPAVAQLVWDDSQEGGIGRLMPEAASITPAMARKLMIRHYADMPTRLAPHARGLLRALAQDAGAPAIVHCTAGKDRTGFVAGLLLEALGVPRETVLEDYLLTNDVVDLRAQLRDDETGLGIPQGRSYLDEMPDDALAATLAADADYLLAAFATIDAAYGSVQRYLQEALGVDEHARGRLSDVLLEPG